MHAVKQALCIGKQSANVSNRGTLTHVQCNMATASQNLKMYRLQVPDRKESADTTPHDVILSFDTTTLMCQFIQQLRDDLQEFITAILARYPETRIAVGHFLMSNWRQ